MGMFDSFMLKTTCPHCGYESVFEFQTKMFDCVLQVWKEGGSFTYSGLHIEKGTIKGVYGSCRENCNKRILCDVLIIDGMVFGAINTRKDEVDE